MAKLNKNKLAKRRMERASERIQATIGDANYFDGDAHDFLMYIYKDKRRGIELRVECAKAAIPYEKAKLSPIMVHEDEEGNESLNRELRVVFVESNRVETERPAKTIEHQQIKLVS